MRYLSAFALSATLSFALVWVWVLAMPMAFMDAEYPSWRAKEILLDRCDLGEAVILGDSRAAADILPARMPFRMTNLAVGGGEAIEALAALTRVLDCPSLPKLVIISLDPGHFVRPDLFWERSVRYGFLSAADISNLRQASREIGDSSVYEARHAEGLPTWLRDWLYRIHFPPLYFASLAHGRGFLRWTVNQHTLKETLVSRGHYYFGTEWDRTAVAVEGHLATFVPLPILDFYFDKLLAELDRRGIDARFIAMPVNQATWDEVRPEVRDAVRGLSGGYEGAYPHFHVAADLMPHWPDRFFGDMFCHLNPEGAERFSADLAQRLQDGTAQNAERAAERMVEGHRPGRLGQGHPHFEARIIGQQRAGHHGGQWCFLPLHHHPRTAHITSSGDLCRIPQQAVVISGTSRSVPFPETASAVPDRRIHLDPVLANSRRTRRVTFSVSPVKRRPATSSLKPFRASQIRPSRVGPQLRRPRSCSWMLGRNGRADTRIVSRSGCRSRRASISARSLRSGFIALVNTSASRPRDNTHSSIAMMSGFMNGSPPVNPIIFICSRSRAISSK